jgi:hypothetical protein
MTTPTGPNNRASITLPSPSPDGFKSSTPVAIRTANNAPSRIRGKMAKMANFAKELVSPFLDGLRDLDRRIYQSQGWLHLVQRTVAGLNKIGY